MERLLLLGSKIAPKVFGQKLQEGSRSSNLHGKTFASEHYRSLKAIQHDHLKSTDHARQDQASSIKRKKYVKNQNPTRKLKSNDI